MISALKALGAAALVTAALLAASARPAAAATPCWKTLLNDWYDGRIDNVYPVHCYTDTLKHLPADVKIYSSAKDDILRALQSAKAQLKASGTKATSNTPVPAETTTTTSSPSSSSSTTTTTASSGPSDTDAGSGSGTTPGRKTDKGGLTGVAQGLNTSSGPSSIPTPLLVLGGLALLLVAAGAVGLVVKRSSKRSEP